MSSADERTPSPPRSRDARPVEVAIDVEAPIAALWSAIAVDEQRRQWWSYLELEPRAGGRLTERWRDAEGRTRTTTGEVLAADAPVHLRCNWRDDDWPATTDVEFELRESSGATRVTVRHGGWERLGDRGSALREQHAQGWRMHLANLRDHVERTRSARGV